MSQCLMEEMVLVMQMPCYLHVVAGIRGKYEVRKDDKKKRPCEGHFLHGSRKKVYQQSLSRREKLLWCCFRLSFSPTQKNRPRTFGESEAWFFELLAVFFL